MLAIGKNLSAALSCLAGALLLTSCNSSQDPEKEAQTGKGKSLSQEALVQVMPQPGKYSQRFKVVDIDVPRIPEAFADHIKAGMAQDKTEEFCLSKKEADKGFREMFDNRGPMQHCQYERFDVAGQNIDALMNCSTPGKGKVEVSLKGQAGATHSDMTVKMHLTDGAGPVSEMNITMQLVSTRIGECTP